jgi:hypothetical protein
MKTLLKIFQFERAFSMQVLPLTIVVFFAIPSIQAFADCPKDLESLSRSLKRLAKHSPAKPLQDEGMWTYDNIPAGRLKETYGFSPERKWRRLAKQASVRFATGGSGSFVSPEGLVMTNHHVARESLQKISTPQRDFIKEGFYAKNKGEEIPVPDLEINQLIEIKNVTPWVLKGIKPGMSAEEIEKIKKTNLAKIEKEYGQDDAADTSTPPARAGSKYKKKAKLKNEVVTLYQGGLYHLYRYKKYTDIRLVFAPEGKIAFFGGDPANFEYPRYNLDVTFFRIYDENGKPIKSKRHFKWSENGAAEGELTFISGHPGTTKRLFTVDNMKFDRDVTLPQGIELLNRRINVLLDYGNRSAEHKRQAQDELFGWQNSLKVYNGQFKGLKDDALMAEKIKAETDLRGKVEADPKLKPIAKAWSQINDAKIKSLEEYQPRRFAEGAVGFDTIFFSWARHLVRLAAENPKQNPDRLPEYQDGKRPALMMELLSEAPVYKEMEEAKLTESLSYMVEKLGADNQIVKMALDGKSPAVRAAEVVTGTKLGEIEARKALLEGGQAAVDASRDPAVVLAKLIDPISRELRKKFETEIDSVIKQAYEQIAQARFAIYGTSVYPDATFTLRLAFGRPTGYIEDDGKQLPPWTAMGNTFKEADDHGGADPWDLPPSWIAAKDRIAPEVPFNFVSTVDTIGGNSGSPHVNKKNEIVGILFDGNRQKLIAGYAYTDKQARSMSVHSSSIIEALRSVYGAHGLAQELTGKESGR